MSERCIKTAVFMLVSSLRLLYLTSYQKTTSPTGLMQSGAIRRRSPTLGQGAIFGQ
jgi:hypothetical protein